MVTTSFRTSEITSGLPRERFTNLTWAEVGTLRGMQRAAVLNDLEKYDIRPRVRLNLAVLHEFKGKDAQDLTVNFGEAAGDITFTGEWVSLKATVAMALDMRRREETQLGAQDTTMKSMSDGYGGKQWYAATTHGFPDLFEIRMPGEAPAVEK